MNRTLLLIVMNRTQLLFVMNRILIFVEMNRTLILIVINRTVHFYLSRSVNSGCSFCNNIHFKRYFPCKTGHIERIPYTF